MRNLSIFIIFSILLYSCDVRNLKSKKDVDATAAPQVLKDSTTVQMIDSVYNFGQVKDGEKVAYDFRFKNTGIHPLIIESARPSCGCTIADKPEKPVQPGETGTIKVVFNSSGRQGVAEKAITVISNAYPIFPTLHLKGVVIK